MSPFRAHSLPGPQRRSRRSFVFTEGGAGPAPLRHGRDSHFALSDAAGAEAHLAARAQFGKIVLVPDSLTDGSLRAGLDLRDRVQAVVPADECGLAQPGNAATADLSP